MKPIKWLAIINPVSGGGNTGKQIEQILAKSKSFISKHQITKYPGHAKKMAEASSKFDGIAVIGGDGTLHEVLTCLDLDKQTLAIIPTGTGNSLARDLDLRSIDHIIDSIESNNIVHIDLMQVTYEDELGFSGRCYSASTLGIGYPAKLVEIGNRFFKPFGKHCYTISATVTTVLKNNFDVLLGYDGGNLKRKSLTGMLINNTRHSGNFMAFPSASIDDGHLDVMETNAGFFKQNLHNISILSKKYFYTTVTLNRMKTLTVKLRKPQLLMIDGELFPNIISLAVNILPRRLKCCMKGRSIP
ncbi:diacylglycerol/lipid kinase family protein [Candidatus Latescibacterota bacterium]